MNKMFVLIILFLISNLLAGQVEVVFQLDANNLKEFGFFKKNSNDKLLVRGSFNNWKGDAFQLSPVTSYSDFVGPFSLSSSIGDTLYYKYVILKENGKSFWEWKPNPSNPSNGNRKLIIRDSVQTLAPTRFHFNEYISYPVVFPKEKLQEDYSQFRNILESTHPALYDYTEKEVLDSLFDKQYAKIDQALPFREFLMLMTGVIAKIGCGHTSLWVPNDYWKVSPERHFPLKLIVSENKLLVSGTFAENQMIPVGSEIIKINDCSSQKIIEELAASSSADGFNRAYKLAKVGQNFSIKYALAYGFPEHFSLEYYLPGKEELEIKRIEPISRDQVISGKSKQNDLSFDTIENATIGVLTISSFGYYGKVDQFKSFIDSTFQEIKDREITKLILDLRGNSGGDPFCSSYLWSYLQPKPLPYFEERYGRYDTLASPLFLPSNHYTGSLFTLIDGHGFSTTGHFCGLLKYHKVGKFIGTELGSTYTCTGNATYPPLNHSGIMVGTARVRRYTVAVKDMNPLEGIIPDYPVPIDQSSLVNNRDRVMDYALKLMRTE
jgi:hypothetical protein